MKTEKNNKVPTTGYILKNWDIRGAYRATAIAYLQREKIFAVENTNGNYYNLLQLKNALIN